MEWYFSQNYPPTGGEHERGKGNILDRVSFVNGAAAKQKRRSKLVSLYFLYVIPLMRTALVPIWFVFSLQCITASPFSGELGLTSLKSQLIKNHVMKMLAEASHGEK